MGLRMHKPDLVRRIAATEAAPNRSSGVPAASTSIVPFQISPEDHRYEFNREFGPRSAPTPGLLGTHPARNNLDAASKVLAGTGIDHSRTTLTTSSRSRGPVA